MKDIIRPDLFPECSTCQLASLAYLKAADDKYLVAVTGLDRARLNTQVRVEISCYYAIRFIFLKYLKMKIDAITTYPGNRAHQGWFQDVTNFCPGLEASQKKNRLVGLSRTS